MEEDIKGLETIEKWLKTLPEDRLIEAYELICSQVEDDDDFVINED